MVSVSNSEKYFVSLPVGNKLFVREYRKRKHSRPTHIYQRRNYRIWRTKGDSYNTTNILYFSIQAAQLHKINFNIQFISVGRAG